VGVVVYLYSIKLVIDKLANEVKLIDCNDFISNYVSNWLLRRVDLSFG